MLEGFSMKCPNCLITYKTQIPTECLICDAQFCADCAPYHECAEKQEPTSLLDFAAEFVRGVA